MDLLKFIGFPKATEYEFKAVSSCSDWYYIYVKRPGKRTWEKCIEYYVSDNTLRQVFLNHHQAAYRIKRWAKDPEIFEEEQNHCIETMKNRSQYSYKARKEHKEYDNKPDVMIEKENRNARKMHEALE